MEYNFAKIGDNIRLMRKMKFGSQDNFIAALSEKDVSIARNRISAIENGDQSQFTLPFLLACCDLFNCDMGYLLGEYECRTMDVQFMHDEIGLSEESISFLRHEKKWGVGQEHTAIIDMLLHDCLYANIDKSGSRKYRSILNLLDFFFNYSNSTKQQQVFIDGTIADPGVDGYISSNAIALNDVVIENAVLAEIQLALINLKKSIAETEGK